MKKYWNKSYEFLRIMEILNDYWLTEKDEKMVEVKMHFEKADGQFQDKLITWYNPNMKHEFELDIVNLADALDLPTMEDFEKK